MAEFNTVCLSGVLRGKVEVYKKQELQVARFFIDVEGTGELRRGPERGGPLINSAFRGEPRRPRQHHCRIAQGANKVSC
jgi:hypothetical protein